MTVPQATKYAIIGAGIHGLSTAFHLAQMLKATGKGSGADILVVDKTAIAAGASGIACGVVRNNYFQPAMRELMAHSVDVWESDAKAYSYHPVGYMQISPECMREDVGSIYEQQKAIGYESVFIEGAGASAKYMKGLFDDWQAQGITSVLHEKRGGYANNKASMNGLAAKAEAEGVRILSGVEVQELRVRLELGRGDGAQYQSRADRLRDGGGRRRPLGQQDLEHARTAESDHRQGERQGPHRRADVEVLVPGGRHARRRPGDAPDQ